MQFPVLVSNDRKEHMESCEFDDGGKGKVIVLSWHLIEALGNDPGLQFYDVSISVLFFFQDNFAAYWLASFGYIPDPFKGICSFELVICTTWPGSPSPTA